MVGGEGGRGEGVDALVKQRIGKAEALPELTRWQWSAFWVEVGGGGRSVYPGWWVVGPGGGGTIGKAAHVQG
jgi:hypothetical protein